MTDITNLETQGNDLLNTIEHDLDTVDLAMSQLDLGNVNDQQTN